MHHEPLSLQDLLRDVPLSLLHTFACDCAEEALLRERTDGREPDPRFWEALRIKRLWLAGQVELSVLHIAQRGVRSALSALDLPPPTAALSAARQAARAAHAAASQHHHDLQHAVLYAASHTALRSPPPSFTPGLLFAAEEERLRDRLLQTLAHHQHARQRLLALLHARTQQLDHALQDQAKKLQHSLFQEN